MYNNISMNNLELNKDTDKWDKNIEQAQLLLKDRKRSCMKIAELALEVCEIAWGGHCNGDVKTLRDFAKETEIHYSTLSNWCSIKRNIYDKLETDLKLKARQGDLVMAARMVGSKASAKEINQAVSDLIYKDTSDRRILVYISELNALLGNLEKKETVALCKTPILEQILYLCSEIMKSIIKNTDRKLKPTNHEIARMKGRIGLNNGDSRVWHLRDNDIKVANFLKTRRGFVGLTEIYKTVFKGEPSNRSKLKTLRSLNKLSQMGSVLRNGTGQYKYKNIRTVSR